MTDRTTRRAVLRGATSVASLGAAAVASRELSTTGASGAHETVRAAGARGATDTATPTETATDGASNWPTFALDNANTGYAPDRRTPEASAVIEWTFETDDWVEASPVVADGTVYVGSNDFNVYALDAADGTERWRVDVDGFPSTPAVAGLADDNWVHSPDDPTVYVGSDEHLRALSAADGAVRWAVTGEATFGTPPTVERGIVYAGNHDGNVYAVTADGGEGRWTYDTGGIVQPAPAVVDGTVYVGSNSGLIAALDAGDGSEVWTVEADESVLSAPAVGEDTVYVGSDDDRLRALATDDGSERWTTAFDSGIRGSPVVGDGTVYAATTDGRMSALDAGDGSEEWRTDVGGVVASPVVVGNRLFVGSLGGRLYALRVDDGEPVWSLRTGADVATTPASADGRIYVGSRDGNVYALGPDPDVTPTPEPTTAEPTPTTTRRTDGEGGTPTDDAASATTGPANGSAPEAGGTASPGPATTGGNADERQATTTGAGADGTAAGDLPTLVGALALGALGAGTLGGGYLWARSDDDDGDRDDNPAGAAGSGSGGGSAGHGSASSPAGDGSMGSGPAGDGPAGSGPAGGGTGNNPGGGDPGADSGFIDSGADFSLTLGAGDTDATAAESSPGGGREANERGAPVDESGGDPRTAADNETWSDPDWPVPDPIPGAPDLAVGYGDIERGELLGRGGQADVYRAQVDTESGSFALKELRGDGAGGPPLSREAETWAALADHAHVVDVVAWGVDPAPWLLIEYMDGGHLARRAGTMGFDQAVWTAVGVTRAVRHAHRRGVVHFDLKPSNVLFRTVEGAWDVPKVADWGLSRRLLTHSGTVEGFSPKYAAPEQVADGFGDPDDRTDVYQLGALFYALFTGRPPYRGEPAAVARAVVDERPPSPSEVADLPPAVDDVLLTAMARDPRDRHESVLYLRDDLMALADER